MKTLVIVITSVIIVVVLIVALGIGGNGVSHNDGSNQKVASVPSGEKPDVPPPAYKPTAYNPITDLVTESIQNTWTNAPSEFGTSIVYSNTSNPNNVLLVMCVESIFVEKVLRGIREHIESNGFDLTDTSYSGLNSETYVSRRDSTTKFIARVQNCSIVMGIDPDGKDDLDAEVKHLQAINGSNQEVVYVPSGYENTPPKLAENGLYDVKAANGFVWEGIKNDWTKTHQDSLNLVNYDDTANGMKSNILVDCFPSLDKAYDTENKLDDVMKRFNYTLTDISYSGISSETYVTGYSKIFIARMQNCIINMKIEPEAQDNLDAEVKHLQHINELNNTY